ncbi:BZ3500_MvSof-1268-A1-R1_Chr1-3g01869 [Microbotryum saponariae]|uniref:BZ3500_MvSof-1268-A1-R1_Chr1-3g01869 protein n=1 Tax=Microbotryum saponariae TaxID=289078 RepID=A0A2X0MS55_9BASI|nr:BZ3500_MvSof-1268-A1-R1_Chr1-3g01869 [Microbotryum saponariae]SCZ94775.1 BZ3501_MvSof-1269-A2-R1_Chr1-3g01471 [Microbotryum saponariae]
MSNGKTVLVTGASGFLASYVIDAFLKAGWNVRGTVRDLSKGQHLQDRYPSGSPLKLVQVKDLVTGEGLEEAIQACDAIAHVASPYHFNITDPKKDLLDPAIEGTLSVLRAAKAVGVTKIVVTSSFAAVTDFTKGGPWRDYTYTAEDWNPSTMEEGLKPGQTGPFIYSLSKVGRSRIETFEVCHAHRRLRSLQTLAERAGKDYAKENGLELATHGPPLQRIADASEVNTSSGAIYALINGSTKGQVPANRLPLFCHVEDVARAHVLALEHLPKVDQQRFLLCGGGFTWEQAILHLEKSRPDLASRLPKLPKDEDRADLNAGPLAKLDCTPAKELLGIERFKTWQETLEETIDRLVEMEKQW